MRKINIEALIYAIEENNYDEMNYAKLSKQRNDYAHFYGLSEADRDALRQRIEHYYHASTSSNAVVMGMMQLLDLDSEQKDRAYRAVRAFDRWQESTHYERCPDRKMLEQIENYIYG